MKPRRLSQWRLSPWRPNPWRRLRSRRRDDGAVGVTFGILLASGVLLGSLAIVVDVGRLYVERGDLQNGADSAALALARACAENEPPCDTASGLLVLAQHYADANAPDGAAALGTVCGEVPGDLLPSCGPQPANLTGCIGSPPPDQYVEVHVSTRLADGSTVLPPAFAQTLSGGNTGTTVGACARAAWGPADLTILAVSISLCEFEDATSGLDPFDDPDDVHAGHERVIQFWFGAHGTCGGPGPGPGWQRPGQAGFLNEASGSSDCRISVTDTGEFTGSYFRAFQPYDLAPPACEAAMRDALGDLSTMDDDEVIYLPVHDGIDLHSDGTATFRHVFVAPFRVTAFQFGSPPSAFPPYPPMDHIVGSLVPGSRYSVGNGPCGTQSVGYRCLTGAFVGEPIDISALTGDNRIRLVG